jgi:hypothetical protein
VTGRTTANVTGHDHLIFPVGPQDRVSQLIQPSSIDHFDVLMSHVDDLDPNHPRFTTADLQLSARFDTMHAEVPEPSSFAFAAIGLAAGSVVAWRKYRARRSLAR